MSERDEILALVRRAARRAAVHPGAYPAPPLAGGWPEFAAMLARVGGVAQGPFRGHELGAALAELVRRRAEGRRCVAEASAALEGLVRARRVTVALQVLSLLLVFIASLVRPRPAITPFLVLAMAHAALGLTVFLVLTAYMEGQKLLGNGYLTPAGQARRKVVFATTPTPRSA